MATTTESDRPDEAPKPSPTMAWMIRYSPKVPVVGGLLEAYLTAPGGVKRLIVVMIVVLVAYPVFVVFAVLGAIQLLPATPRVAAQKFILASVGFDDEKQAITMVNRSNQTVDGSMPMSFNFTRPDSVDDRYYQVIDRDQAISFWTYQKGNPRLSNDPRCVKPAALDEDVTLGSLVLRNPDRSYKKEIPILASFDTLSRISEKIDAKEWEKINAAQPGSGPVQLLMKFQPNAAFAATDYFFCNSVSVYLNMTFLKPILSGGRGR